jgi:hypothetical protein
VPLPLLSCGVGITSPMFAVETGVLNAALVYLAAKV